MHILKRHVMQQIEGFVFLVKRLSLFKSKQSISLDKFLLMRLSFSDNKTKKKYFFDYNNKIKRSK